MIRRRASSACSAQNWMAATKKFCISSRPFTCRAGCHGLPTARRSLIPTMSPSRSEPLRLYDVDSGKKQILTFADKAMLAMQWSITGDGLFVTFREKGPNVGRMQIGFVSLPDGQLHPISRDTNNYSTLTLSADGKTLATVQQKAVSNLYILPGAGSMSPTASPLLVDGENISSFNWALGRCAVDVRFHAPGANRCERKKSYRADQRSVRRNVCFVTLRCAIHRLALGVPWRQ